MKRAARLGLLIALLTSLHVGTAANKSGCSDEEMSKLTSPVQAIVTVFRQTDGVVSADLTLISTAVTPSVFVNAAKDATLRVVLGGGDVKSVPLARTADGHYAASSAADEGLVWEPSAIFAFDFVLEADADGTGVAGGTFSAQVTAPANGVTLTVTEAPAAPNLVAKIAMAGTYGRGLLRVYGPDGAPTYANFDTATPDFDGSKWNSLIVGASHTIPAAAFPVAGDYRVEFGACSFVQGFDPEVSAELGWLSGFLACDGTEVSLTVP